MLRNSLVRRGSTSPTFTDPFNVFDRFFDTDFFRPTGWFSPELPHNAWVPAVDSRQTDAAYILEVDLPGLRKDDVHVTVENNVLTLTGERNLDRETSDGNYDRVERSYGKFSRSFTLPTHVDAGSVKASFDNGVLTVTLPKVESAKSREIKIQ